jgi:hypothetical protein
MTVKMDAEESPDLPLDALEGEPQAEPENEENDVEFAAPEMPLDGGVLEAEAEIPLDGGVLEAEVDIPLDGSLLEPVAEKTLRECGFPIEATCFCCGKTQWLRWVFDGQHVCEECKDFLMEKYNITEVAREEFSADQLEIIHLLRREGNLSSKDITELLNKNKYSVDRNLRLLQESNQVLRKKEGRAYIYYLNE